MKTITHGKSVSYELDGFDIIQAIREYLLSLKLVTDAVDACDITVYMNTNKDKNDDVLITATGLIKPPTHAYRVYREGQGTEK